MATGESVPPVITPTDKRILNACGSGATFREIVDATGMSASDVTRSMGILQGRALISTVGERNGARIFAAAISNSHTQTAQNPTCGACGKLCASERGLAMHMRRSHERPPLSRPSTPPPPACAPADNEEDGAAVLERAKAERMEEVEDNLIQIGLLDMLLARISAKEAREAKQ